MFADIHTDEPKLNKIFPNMLYTSTVVHSAVYKLSNKCCQLMGISFSLSFRK